MSDEKYPRRGKLWTEEETEYLCEQWGTTTIKRLSQNLGRTESAIALRAVELGLGKWVHNSSLLTFSEIADGMGYSVGWVDRLVEKGLKVKRKRGTPGMTYRLVELNDLWKFLEKHKDEFDLSRMEPGAFGKEPDWVAGARRRSAMRGPIKRHWTPEMEGRLLAEAKRGDRTAYDIAEKFGMSVDAVKSKLRNLGGPKLKPRRNRAWTAKEKAKLKRMMKAGKSQKEMAEALGRTIPAIRGAVHRLYAEKRESGESG